MWSVCSGWGGASLANLVTHEDPSKERVGCGEYKGQRGTRKALGAEVALRLWSSLSLSLKIFIYLVLVGFFCSTWDLVLWLGLEPESLALGARSHSCCAPREVPPCLSWGRRVHSVPASCCVPVLSSSLLSGASPLLCVFLILLCTHRIRCLTIWVHHEPL